MYIWLLMGMAAVALIAATFTCVAVVWRRVLAAFRAMNWIAGTAFAAGIAFGVAGVRVATVSSNLSP